MSGQTSGQGFALLCQPCGVIDRFVRDELDLHESFCGRHFKELLDAGSRAKSQMFLDTVRAQGVAVGWELDVNLESVPQTMRFVGGDAGEMLLICGVHPRGTVSTFLQELAQVASEDKADIQRVVHRLIELRTPPLSEADTLECLSRINNELLNVQRELHKKNIELKRLNDEKNRAMGIVAHDLRNPIAVLTMYATHLKRSLEGRLTDEEHDFLSTIKDTATSMNDLVNDVLDVAAIESGQLTLDIAEIDITRLLDSTVQRLRPLAREQNVQLAWQARGPHRVPGDERKLEQVFNNLIDNAIKFSPAGGVVEIAVTADPADVVVTVVDSGPGISQEALKTLFQPFAGGRSKSSRGTSGKGLGLSIARRIVDGHGGSIEATSSSAPGTVFTVSLPRSV